MIQCLIMSKATGRPISKEQEKFKQYLENNKLKMTSGRDVIFKKVMGSHGHFTAEDLIKNCQNNSPKVSRASIYRNIKELLQAGIIRKTAFGEKHEHYEHVYDEILHHHARCIHCYSVVEFPCLNCDSKYIQFLKQKNFQVLGHEMHFYGICQKCQRKNL